MEFVCRDPHAVVRAANVKATLDAFSFEPAFGRRIVQKYDLWEYKLQPTAFVPVQRWLDALQDIQRTVGGPILHRVGKAIIERADFPPTLPTAESILEKLDDIYYMNHRGDVGHYRVSKEDGVVVVRCETPYPRHFERGLIEGICSKHPGRADVQFTEGAPHDELTCTVRVRFR